MKYDRRPMQDGTPKGDPMPTLICTTCHSPDIAVRTRNFKVSYLCRRCGGIRPVKHVYEK